MATKKHALLFLATYLLSEDALWELKCRRVQKKRKHRVWVRDFIRERLDDPSNTAYKLQLQSSVLKDEHEFRTILRMGEPQYKMLVEKVTQVLEKQNTTFRAAISTNERLTVTLTYLAAGGTNASLSRLFRIGRSTAGTIIRETCAALYEVLQTDYLCTPDTSVGWLKVAKGFDTCWDFPHCLGVLDGKHIRIQSPPSSCPLYFNYKGDFSIVLLALVDADYSVLYVDVGAEGRQADGRIWRDSSLRQSIDSNSINIPEPACWEGAEHYGPQPFVIVGDDAFSMSQHLMKSYSGKSLRHRERIFNYRLSRVRRISENFFGILASRFRLLQTEIKRSPDIVITICMAIVCLHNFLRKEDPSSYIGETSVDFEDTNHNVVQGDWRKGGNLDRLQSTSIDKMDGSTKEQRDTLAHYFSSPAGSLPWQEDHI